MDIWMIIIIIAAWKWNDKMCLNSCFLWYIHCFHILKIEQTVKVLRRLKKCPIRHFDAGVILRNLSAGIRNGLYLSGRSVKLRLIWSHDFRLSIFKRNILLGNLIGVEFSERKYKNESSYKQCMRFSIFV